jgi:2-dehydro-3-deoxygalactonokinase
MAAYLSGVLIGAELAARPQANGAEVVLVASGVLAARYGAGLDAAGQQYRLVDAEPGDAGRAVASRALWPKA